ncbi:MAG: hypothetical protein J6U37_04755 [Lachnospiraceae bacterium]|nr:hypothetical protein [Lachnospiraceae bacterium]
MSRSRYKLVQRIEPDKPINTIEEICAEVKSFFNRDNKTINVISQDGVLVFTMDDKKYVARTDKFFGWLGGGRDILKPYPLHYFGGFPGNVGGFKFVYIYDLGE